MNHLVKTLFTVLLFLSVNAANAKIVEISSMKEVIPYINARTLMIFDIDNTITEPVQTLGSDQAFGHWVDQGLNRGLSKAEAVGRALGMAGPVQPITEVRAVERKTPDFISSLQSSGLPVIALTARPGAWARGTFKQLDSLNVSFKNSSPRLPNTRLKYSNHTDGVIFLAEGANKGDALIEYIQATGLQPNRILFIDDKLNNVESVEKALNETSYEHASFRYGAADKRVAAFNPMILQIELREFLKTGRFISDEQAAYLLTADRAH